MGQSCSDDLLFIFVGGMVISFIFRKYSRSTRLLSSNHSPVLKSNPLIKGNWKTFDPLLASEEKWSKYSMLISAVVPRPIALVSSHDASSTRNCAPFRCTECFVYVLFNLCTSSYFGIICHDPLLISISVCTRGSAHGKKDTLRNIEDTKQFVVNIMSDWYVEAANLTCGEYPPEVDEIALSGLHTLPSTMVGPERIAEAAVQMECEVCRFHQSCPPHLIISRFTRLRRYTMTTVNTRPP